MLKNYENFNAKHQFKKTANKILSFQSKIVTFTKETC
jgi:hypothetical protein